VAVDTAEEKRLLYIGSLEPVLHARTGQLAGGQSFTADALANAALYRMQAQELAVVLAERCRQPERCYVRSSRIYRPLGQNGPVTIDLVAAFQSVLDKARAREAAKREAFRNDTRFRILRVLRAEMMELRERRAALQSPGHASHALNLAAADSFAHPRSAARLPSLSH